MDVAVIILISVLFTEVINNFLKPHILNFAFYIYSNFISPHSKSLQSLKKEILITKTELGKTSSQSEFAKWARLKRKLDKGYTDYEKLNSSLSTQKATITYGLSTILWTLTTGLQFILLWWYRKVPMFYLPKGWTGLGVGRWLSWGAGSGAISATGLALILRRVIKSIIEIYTDWFVFVPEPVEPTSPFAMPTEEQQERSKPPLRAPSMVKEKAEWTPPLDLD